MTFIFAMMGIFKAQVNTTGSTKIAMSDIALMIESAIMTADRSKHAPFISLITVQYVDTGIQPKAFTKSIVIY